MENTFEPTINPETGLYDFPERPLGLPDEDDLPRKYEIKEYSTEEIEEYRHYRAVRGHSITKQVKGEVNVLSDNGELETLKGWLVDDSGLIFRSLQLGLVKTKPGWSVIERNIGVNLMPELQPDPDEDENGQFSFDFHQKPENDVIKTFGKTREKAIELSILHVKYFSSQDWIELQEQLNYCLDGISSELILTPEEQELSDEWGRRISIVNKANNLKIETNNFYGHYKPLRIHEHSSPRPKMTRKKNGIRVAEKIDPKKKIKFFVSQDDYSHMIKVEGILLPFEMDKLTEIKDLVIVKGDQFKGTPLEEAYTNSKYTVFDPYLGIPSMRNAASSMKAAKDGVQEWKASPEAIEKLNQRVKEHHEKIQAANTDGEDITRFLNLIGDE